MAHISARYRALRGWGTLVLAALAASCAAPRTTTLPAPPQPAERPGPWDATYALYDPGHFGPERPLPDLIREHGLSLRDGKIRDARLLLNKAQRRLELWVRRRMVKAYRVQLGGNPIGRKVRQGDERTPEGEYFICRSGLSQYCRALWISYPNLDDARRGLETAVIGRKAHDAIVEALKRKDCPPQNTKLGGYLLLHGQFPEHSAEEARKRKARGEAPPPGLEIGDIEPASVDEFYDWTQGCAALFNPDIRELYDLLPVGTPLKIIADGPITVPSPAD